MVELVEGTSPRSLSSQQWLACFGVWVMAERTFNFNLDITQYFRFFFPSLFALFFLTRQASYFRSASFELSDSSRLPLFQLLFHLGLEAVEGCVYSRTFDQSILSLQNPSEISPVFPRQSRRTLSVHSISFSKEQQEREGYQYGSLPR